jgi:hypothetical protein
MPGVFGLSTRPMAMGRVNRAIFNNPVGSVTVTLRARLGGSSGYGLGGSSNVSLYASFAGRSYTYTY